MDCWIINQEISVHHLDIRHGEGTDHCGEAQFANVQVNTLCDGQELIAPVSSFHLPSNSHYRCANTAVCMSVCSYVELKGNLSDRLLFSINPTVEHEFTHTQYSSQNQSGIYMYLYIFDCST